MLRVSAPVNAEIVEEMPHRYANARRTAKAPLDGRAKKIAEAGGMNAVQTECRSSDPRRNRLVKLGRVRSK